MSDDQEQRPDQDDQADIESTLELLTRARHGDRAAMELLIERCLPPLRRWAHGRLPQFARDRLDTSDLVQEAVRRVLGRLEQFDARHVGALQAYLRKAVKNQICDEIRRVRRRSVPVELTDTFEDEQPSALETLISRENVEHYLAAMKRLQPSDRELIVARYEMGLDYESIAVATGRPTAAAARMAVIRAIDRLGTELKPGATI
jgi:RNA polymerase sigma-70 factor, ECF subfamily